MGALDGRVALITGAARGQGRAHALALAAEGASIVAVDICAPIASVPYDLATADDLNETVRLVEALGVPALGVVADTRDSRQVDAAVDRAVAAFGGVAVLIANAGVYSSSPVDAMPDEQWRELLDTNLTGTFFTIRAVLPHMRRAGYGRIVAISSGAGRTAYHGLGHYTASKWGVIGLVKVVALETAGTGITANVIAPATVRTTMVMHEANIAVFCPDLPDATEDDMIDRMRAANPMGVPYLEPEDISRAVMYLVCDRGVTTGTVIEVNLGTSANRS
jgi:SDR family mycofactocin-dependent oxidoreductase